MRKIVVALALTLISFSAFAQKPSVNKASRYLRKGELNDAKKQIEITVESEKYGTDPEAWYKRGEIYQAIAKEGDSTDQETLFTAIESYRKAMELGGENGKYSLFADQKINEIWSVFINKGATAYDAGDLESARKSFESAGAIKPQDSTGYLYAAISAQELENWSAALDNYYKLLETNYSDKETTYSTILYIERAINKNDEKALEVVREARAKYPSNIDFAKSEINILIATNKVDEAKQELNSAIEAEPDNANLYFNRAVLYEELDENDKAVADYKKAIELDPAYFDANFNLAVIYYNKGAGYLKTANDMDLKTYQKKGAALEKKAKAEFKSALPYMEKCAELQPEDKVTLSTLQTLYGQLRMYEKAEKVNNKMKDLGYNN